MPFRTYDVEVAPGTFEGLVRRRGEYLYIKKDTDSNDSLTA